MQNLNIYEKTIVAKNIKKKQTLQSQTTFFFAHNFTTKTGEIVKLLDFSEYPQFQCILCC